MLRLGSSLAVRLGSAIRHILAIIARAGGGAFAAGRIKPFADFVGLGALAVKEEFLSQYKGEGAFTVVKGESAEGEISAISGATVTSKAVTLGVNIALAEFSGRSFEQ